MINTNRLKGLIVEKGYSQSEIAKRIGITPKTFYTKMDKGVFNSNEIDVIIHILSIKNPRYV
ncbi:MAG: helix-turn-helix transcriptional regulator [Anaerovoracaceae bacterium]